MTAGVLFEDLSALGRASASYHHPCHQEISFVVRLCAVKCKLSLS
jgi:hypothetical protein